MQPPADAWEVVDGSGENPALVLEKEFQGFMFIQK
jgi:hypothetical protein